MKNVIKSFIGLPVRAVEVAQPVTAMSFKEGLAWAGLALAQGFAVGGAFVAKAVL